MCALFGRVAGDDIAVLLDRRRGWTGVRSELKRGHASAGLRIQNVRALAPAKKLP
jgi:hypothetical protein